MPRHMSCTTAQEQVARALQNLLEGKLLSGTGHLNYKQQVGFQHIKTCQNGLCSAQRIAIEHARDIKPKNKMPTD